MSGPALRAEVNPVLRDAPTPGTPTIGEVLIERGSIDAPQLEQALEIQESDSRRIGEILVDTGVVASRDLAAALAEQAHMELVDLRRAEIDRAALATIPAEVARAHRILPVSLAEGTLRVAVADPFDSDLNEVLAALPVQQVDLTVAERSEISSLIDLRYSDLDHVGSLVDEYEETKPALAPLTRTIEINEDAPVAQVLNRIVTQALRDRASDVHIEPMEDRLRVRFRVDGALTEMLSMPSSIASALVSRIKILAEMNIVERRRPQDGQFATVVDGRELDVRVSTTATIFGEKAVLRLLDKGRSMRSVTELGMPAEAFKRYEEAVRAPYGMVLVTGPTGSGKTTTLYATLRLLDRGDINIMTIEDPVEYVFSGVNQIEINNQAEVTFATGLKSILRQDPDIILVGEVRDIETARIAIQSALTGHLVLSSLHAVDCASSLFRLLDMGIEPFLVTSAVTGVVAQRLVRKICDACAADYRPSPSEMAFYELYEGPRSPTFRKGVGCAFCANSGYRERLGVYEVMNVTDDLRQMLIAGASPRDVRDLAAKEGMRSLRDEALTLVGDGVTTIEEVLRTVHMAT
jgi:type IV pilus assembly protein PilB